MHPCQAYLAPELLSEPLSYLGRPVDTWALGAVVYEMIHGKFAFSGGSLEQVQSRIRAVKHQQIDPQVGRTPKAMIQGLLVYDPLKRLTAKEVLSRPWVANAFQEYDATCRIRTRHEQGFVDREFADELSRTENLSA